MSNLLTLLKVGADVKLTRGQAQHLADLIEQQQARIAELEETLKNLGDATLSSLVKQFDEAPEGAEFDRTHPILQLAISHFAVAQRNDELSATVERLRGALKHLHHNAKASGAEMGLALDVASDALEATPRQNLNAIKREVAREAFIAGAKDAVAFISQQLRLGKTDIDLDAGLAAGKYIERIKDGEQ